MPSDESRMILSIVVPVLDEEAAHGPALASARAGLATGDELVVVDGGSSDRTVEIARRAGAEVVLVERGRGRQLNAGAARAGGDVLLFLHADTHLPAGYRAEIERALFDGGARWGRFDVRFDEGGPLLRLIAWLISRRSRLFQSATGDQAIFVRRADFEAAGGFREAHLFEDVEFVRRIRARGAMAIPSMPVVTSSRRWRKEGVLATTLRMWSLKSLYLAGVPAKTLERYYSDRR
jgi:rSAM/selenodomain-associated transferase 2